MPHFTISINFLDPMVQHWLPPQSSQPWPKSRTGWPTAQLEKPMRRKRRSSARGRCARWKRARSACGSRARRRRRVSWMRFCTCEVIKASARWLDGSTLKFSKGDIPSLLKYFSSSSLWIFDFHWSSRRQRKACRRVPSTPCIAWFPGLERRQRPRIVTWRSRWLMPGSRRSFETGGMWGMWPDVGGGSRPPSGDDGCQCFSGGWNRRNVSYIFL